MKYLIGFLVGLLLAGSPMWAQDTTIVDANIIDAVGGESTADLVDVFGDLPEWNAFTTRVEAALQAGRASNADSKAAMAGSACAAGCSG